MNFLLTLTLILIAIVYLLAITYIHNCIMQTCYVQEQEQKRVIGSITDTRPNNLINKDLK